MKGITPLKRFADIPEGQYIGYCWYSDKSFAELDVDPRTLDVGSNPFVIEGMWFSLDGKTAVTYKHVGAQSFLNLVDLTQFSDSEKSEQVVLSASGMSKVAHLTFTTLWAPVADPNCANMPVLKPVLQVLTNLKRKA
jgi:CRISPR type III-associated protein (TIGR04423 family)